MSRAGTVAAIVLSAVMTPAIALAQGNGNGRAASHREQMRFRGMDTDNDGVITRAEWRGDDQSFREHDLNHDGVLSGEEVAPRAVTDGTIDHGARKWPPGSNRRTGTATARSHGANGPARRRLSSEWTKTAMASSRATSISTDRGTRGCYIGHDIQHVRPVEHDSFAKYDACLPGRLRQGPHRRAQAGKEDKDVNGGHWDLDGQRELEQADSGYTQDLGARTDYQAGYRAGFRLGYREGFGPRR